MNYYASDGERNLVYLECLLPHGFSLMPSCSVIVPVCNLSPPRLCLSSFLGANTAMVWSYWSLLVQCQPMSSHHLQVWPRCYCPMHAESGAQEGPHCVLAPQQRSPNCAAGARNTHSTMVKSLSTLGALSILSHFLGADQ